MSATRTSTSIAPTRKVKAYTNTGTTPVVVTLTLVSQDSTVNPQISVKIDDDATFLFDYQLDDASINQLNNNGFWLGYTNSSITPTFGDVSSQPRLGGRNIKKANGSDYESTGYNNSYPFDPYFIMHPEEAGMGTGWKYMASIKNSSSTVYHFDDISSLSNASWESALNNSISGHTSQTSMSYFENANGGIMHCPYYGFAIGMQSNAYATMMYPYTKSSHHSQNRSSNGWIYQVFSGSNPYSYMPDVSGTSGKPSGTAGWWWSGSHGIYLFNGSQYSGGYYYIFDTTGVLGDTRYAGNSTVNSTAVENMISSSYTPPRIQGVQNQNNINYMCHNPWTSKFYIRTCGASEGDNQDALVEYHKGTRVAGNVSGRSTTGDSNVIKSTNWGDAFTVVSENSGSNGIPTGMYTTRPMCVGYQIWVCKGTNGTLYFSNDIINWKTLSNFDTSAPTGSGYTVLNEIGSPSLGNQIKYYGKAGQVTRRNEDGWALVPAAGTLENKTSAGNYERTAIIVPAGDSLYVNNHHNTASVACNVLAVAL